MRTLFVAAVAVLVVISIDGWLCLRTLTPGALARSPTFNPLIATTVRRFRLFRTMVITCS